MISIEKLAEIIQQKWDESPIGTTQAEFIAFLAKAIRAELEPEPQVKVGDKPKTLKDFLREQYGSNYQEGNLACDQEAVKNWLASKPKEMTAGQLLAKVEKETKTPGEHNNP